MEYQKRRALRVVAFAVACSSCQKLVVDEPTVEVSSALSAVSFPVSISTPKSVSPVSVVLAAAGTMTIFGGTTVTRPGTALSVITNTGSGGIDAEPDDVLGDIWSTSTVTLKDRVHVRGRIRAPTVVKGNLVIIDGGVDSTTPLTPSEILSWTVTYPAISGTSAPNVIVQNNATTSAAPGRFGSMQVFGGSTLNLRAGTYYVDSLDLESNAKVILDQDAGPVLVYVRTTIILRGAFSSKSGDPPDLLLAWLGTTEAIVESSFKGTLVSPSAKLTLRAATGGHTGAFFGKNIEVGPNTTVTYRAPNVILTTQPRGTFRTCTQSIVPSDTLTGVAREQQYQLEILRYCTGLQLTSCERTLRARMNVDFVAAAAQMLGNHMPTGVYAQLIRDRDAAASAFRKNPTLACNVVGHDGDGDFIPDPTDACPNTPSLTPVLPNGCTNTQIPPGPPISEIQSLIKDIGVNIDPRCVGATTPSVPAPLGAWRFPSDPSVGKAVWVSRESASVACPLFYQIEVVLTDGLGVRSVTFPATEDVSLPWITRPAGAVQFNMHTSDTGNRGAWASYSVFTRSYRARAFNLAGQKSAWSDYFAGGNEDCVVGEPCQDR